MSDSALRRFDFHAQGLASRRDPDTQPRCLLVGLTEQNRTLEYHRAGDKWVRARSVLGVLDDSEFIAGFSPVQAAKIGAASERVRAENAQDHIRGLRRIVQPG